MSREPPVIEHNPYERREPKWLWCRRLGWMAFQIALFLLAMSGTIVETIAGKNPPLAKPIFAAALFSAFLSGCIILFRDWIAFRWRWLFMSPEERAFTKESRRRAAQLRKEQVPERIRIAREAREERRRRNLSKP